MKRRFRLTITLLGLLALTLGVEAQTFRVMTYNAGLLKALGSDYVPLVDLRAARAPGIVAAQVAESKPDILLLEEIWDPRHAEALRAGLEPLGYTVVRPTARGVLLGLTSGLVLAVRSPLEVVDWKFTRFTANTFLEGFARKGVLEATVRTPGGALFAVLGTHTVALDTTGGVAREPGQVRVFRRQADQILSALARRTRGGTEPAILLGDFNVGPGYADAEYRRIEGAPGIDEAGELAAPGDTLVTWDPENPLVKHGEYPNEPAAKIDHIFLVAGSSARWTALSAERLFREPVAGLELPVAGAAAEPVPLSDHYGFAAVVTLEDR